MYPRILALVLTMALLTAGCLSVDITQKVDRDGSSRIIQEMDLSELPSAGSLFGTSTEELCGEIMDDNPGVGCTFDDDLLTLNRTIMAEENQYLFNRTLEFPYSVYSIELKSMPAVVGQKTRAELGQDVSDVNDFKDSSAKPTAAMLRAAGMEIEYNIEMPGELVSVENGETRVDADGREYASYDVLELMSDGEYMRVQSKELDLIAIGTVAGAVVLLIGGIVVTVVLRKAMEKKRKGGFGR